MRNDVISANKGNSEDSENKIIASINAHYQIVQKRDSEIAALTKSFKESELKFQEAKKELEKHIALIRQLEGKIFTIEEDKLLLS